jgi:putative transposase
MSLTTRKYRLYPTKSQERNLFLILNVARAWYNMLLCERKYAYELEGRSVTKYDQLAQIKFYKQTFPQAKQVHSHVLQVATVDADKAFAAFFQRVRNGETPGYPRFKGRNHFHSFGFKEYGNGFRLEGKRLKISGAGKISVRLHRPIPQNGIIKTARIVYKAGQWYVAFSIDVGKTFPLPETGNFVGIDVGINSLTTTSTGKKSENPKYYRTAQVKLRVLQRALQRKTKGGKNRRKALIRVQRQHLHIANQRMDVLHKLSTELVLENDGIALEDLSVRNMVRNKHLSKSILDSGWGIFKQYLTYKAVSAGREIRLVNPAYTSKCCSNCGQTFENFSLSTRWVMCDCGLSLDRDHNAAINILKRAGWDASVQGNVGVKAKRSVEATSL